MSEELKFNDATLVGIPTMGLLPAKSFYFKVSESKFKIVLPRKGKFTDIDADAYSEDDGEFIIVSDDNNAINLATITRVLFATKKYPNINKNQLFCPASLVVNGDTVEIYGQVVEMMDAPFGLTTP